MKRFYFTVVKCLLWKVYLTIKYQKFWHFEMSAIWLKFRNAQSLTNALKRVIYSTVLKNLIVWLFKKIWLTIRFQKFWQHKMFFTAHNFQNAQLLAYLIKQLLFYGTKISARKLIWPSNLRKFDILKCVLQGSILLFNSEMVLPITVDLAKDSLFEVLNVC